MLDFSKYPSIPERTQGSFSRYINHGIPPGSFVTAVLTNNLVESVGAADTENLIALTDIARFIYNELPCSAWGNQNIVDAWIEKGGLDNEVS